MRIMAALALIVFLGGCATQGTPLWITSEYDPATDPRRFERDRYECRRDATYMDPGTAVGVPIGRGLFISRNVGEGAEVDLEMMKACMGARGYTLTYR